LKFSKVKTVVKGIREWDGGVRFGAHVGSSGERICGVAELSMRGNGVRKYASVAELNGTSDLVRKLTRKRGKSVGEIGEKDLRDVIDESQERVGEDAIRGCGSGEEGVAESSEIGAVFAIFGFNDGRENFGGFGEEARRGVWLDDGDISVHGRELGNSKVGFGAIVSEEWTRFKSGGSAGSARGTVEDVCDPVVSYGGTTAS
jgi:hypothetical protein